MKRNPATLMVCWVRCKRTFKFYCWNWSKMHSIWYCVLRNTSLCDAFQCFVLFYRSNNNEVKVWKQNENSFFFKIFFNLFFHHNEIILFNILLKLTNWSIPSNKIHRKLTHHRLNSAKCYLTLSSSWSAPKLYQIIGSSTWH